MSKNFELLHNISNEKDLFQTLDGWEGTDDAAADAEQGAEFDERTHGRTQRQSSLPDVFQAVDDTLGPFDLVTPDFSRKAEPVQKPIDNPLEKRAQAEAQSRDPEGWLPISRNFTTRLISDPDIPQAWTQPEIGPRANDEVELELEPEARSISSIPEVQQVSERVDSSSDTRIQKSSPAKEEKTDYEAQRSRPFRNVAVDADRSAGGGRRRRGRSESAYKDPKREAIAREEELKLVQRIFLAQENSPQMVLFSGFERDTGCASICIRSGEILAAQSEGSVCLVDMGLRVPSLHEYCGVQNDRGLAEAVSESAPIRDFAHQLSPANLWMIPSGHGAPQLNFAKVADQLRARMEELRGAFSYVVIHSGSLWLNADAMLMSKWTDGVVLILEAHSTRRDTARRIKESLAVANARVLGVVLNNRTYPIPETLYSRL